MHHLERFSHVRHTTADVFVMQKSILIGGVSIWKIAIWWTALLLPD